MLGWAPLKIGWIRPFNIMQKVNNKKSVNKNTELQGMDEQTDFLILQIQDRKLTT